MAKNETIPLVEKHTRGSSNDVNDDKKSQLSDQNVQPGSSDGKIVWEDLDSAIKSKNGEKISECIIKTWKEAFKDGWQEECGECELKTTPFIWLIITRPDKALEVMNRCVVKGTKACCKAQSSKEKCDYYYELFHLPKENTDMNKTIPRQKANEIRRMNHPISIMIDFKRDELYGHELVTSYLKHKWQVYKIISVFLLVLYFAFVVCLTTFIVLSPPPFAIRQVFENGTIEWYDTGRQFSSKPIVSIAKVSRGCMCLMIIFTVLKEVFQMFYGRKEYFKNPQNILELVIALLAVVVILPVSGLWYAERLCVQTEWQWQCSALALLLAWLNFVLCLQSFDWTGLYVIMFTDILKTFLSVFFVFLFFIVAFAMAFYTLLLNQAPFNTVRYSLAKTFVMMLGEIDFGDIFHGQDYLMSEGYHPDEPEYFLTNVFYPTTTYIVFALFATVVIILLMNLLVGLAVYDIEQIKTKAQAKTNKMRMYSIFQAQKVLPDCWITWINEHQNDNIQTILRLLMQRILRRANT